MAQRSGRLDVLVNDIWSGDELTEWGKPFWELDLDQGFGLLDTFGVTTANWQDAAATVQGCEESETATFVGRAIAALADADDCAGALCSAPCGFGIMRARRRTLRMLPDHD